MSEESSDKSKVDSQDGQQDDSTKTYIPKFVTSMREKTLHRFKRTHDVRDLIRRLLEDPFGKPQKKPNFFNLYGGIEAKDAFGRPCFEVRNWIYNYWSCRVEDTFEERNDRVDAIEANITTREKQAIMEFLGDWCLYKDWDSFVASLPENGKAERLNILVMAIILKDVFENLVRNPFWYMDLGTEWDGRTESMPPLLGQEHYQFWQKTVSVYPKKAYEWAGLVTDLMNISSAESWRGAPEDRIASYQNLIPETRSFNLREEYINQLATKMLSKSSLIWPMKGLPTTVEEAEELDDELKSSRARRLPAIYKEGGDFAVRMWALGLIFNFDEDVQGIAPYKEPSPDGEPRWHPEGYVEMLNPDYSSSFTGRNAVLILWPTTWSSSRKPRVNGWLDKKILELAAEGDHWALWDEEKIWRHNVIFPGYMVIGKEGLKGPPRES